MDEIEIAVIGAGPHGLAAVAHLRRAGAECQVFGDPMSFWQTMPAGMLLRSNWPATCIAEHEGPLSLDSYCTTTGRQLRTPVPLERFIEYGTWVQQQVAPDVDPRRVERTEYDGERFVLTMDDGAGYTRTGSWWLAGSPTSCTGPPSRRAFLPSWSRIPQTTGTSAGSTASGCWSSAADRARSSRQR